MDTGSLLATTHDAGGMRVRLRLARPSDALGVRSFLERERPELAGDVKRLTFFDPRERLVVVATVPSEGAEAVVGLVDTADARPVTRGEDRNLGELLSRAGASLSARFSDAA